MSIASLERWAVRFTRIVAFLGLVALLSLAAVILANATMRWLFAAPIDGVRDWYKLIIAIAVSSCIPAVMAERQNIVVRFVGRTIKGRGEVGLELFGAVLTLVFLGLLAWQLQIVVGEFWRSGETTETLGFPIAPWWQVVTILFYLSVAVQTVVVVSLAAALIAGRPLPDHAGLADPTEDPVPPDAASDSSTR